MLSIASLLGDKIQFLLLFNQKRTSSEIQVHTAWIHTLTFVLPFLQFVGLELGTLSYTVPLQVILFTTSPF